MPTIQPRHLQAVQTALAAAQEAQSNYHAALSVLETATALAIGAERGYSVEIAYDKTRQLSVMTADSLIIEHAGIYAEAQEDAAETLAEQHSLYNRDIDAGLHRLGR